MWASVTGREQPGSCHLQRLGDTIVCATDAEGRSASVTRDRWEPMIYLSDMRCRGRPVPQLRKAGRAGVRDTGVSDSLSISAVKELTVNYVQQ